MAFNYPIKAGDKQYRIVPLTNTSVGPWTDCPQQGNIEYSEQCVLEVEHGDGTTSVEYERAVRAVSVGRIGTQLFFPNDIPTARMWLRSDSGMMYKVPVGLPEKDAKIYMLIPGGIQNATLAGDIYFNKVYHLTLG